MKRASRTEAQRHRGTESQKHEPSMKRAKTLSCRVAPVSHGCTMRDMRVSKRRHLRLLAVALALGCALATVGTAPIAAQSGRKPPPKAPPVLPGQDPDADVQLGTQEVLLNVTVRDANGRPVKGLTGEDFIVAEDRVRQELASCREAMLPVNVVLVLDASGSVFSERVSIRKAAGAFASELGPEDRVSVIQFADKVELLQDWTTDREAIQHALDWRYRGGEATAYWDALFLAAEDQLSKVEGRRAIILLSDGVDTSSKLSEDHVKAALDRCGASLYVVSEVQAIVERIKPYAGKSGALTGSAKPARAAIGELIASEERMKRLADRYGGRLYSPISFDELDQAYKDVALELKQQYVLTYISANEVRDGRWRAIEIFPTRPGMTVRTRKGYAAQ